MANYTELIFGASFRADTPPEVINTLLLLAGSPEADTSQQPCFSLKGGINPLAKSSYSFAVCEPLVKMFQDPATKCWVLSSRTNIANHQNVIEDFLAWLCPYLDEGSGESKLYAIVMRETGLVPDLYYLDKFGTGEQNCESLTT